MEGTKQNIGARKMKYFIAAVILLFSTTVFAQNATTPQSIENRPKGQIFQLAKPVICNDSPVVRNWLTNIMKFIPIAMGKSKNQMGEIDAVMSTYVNPRDGSFVVIEAFPNRTSCILFQGVELMIDLPTEEDETAMLPDMAPKIPEGEKEEGLKK